MGIQWFPGHMMKTMRMMQDNVKLVDCVIYVLDARIPASCINPYFEPMLGDTPVIYLLNKADLADPAVTAKWVRALRSERTRAIELTATTTRSVKDIVSAVNEIGSQKAEQRRAKGFNYTPRAMVVGVPNTGKSTVINSMCGKGKTVTGNRPGVTRGKQWVRIGGTVDLLDTPGTLPQKFDDETVARHLAYVGSIKDEIIDVADLAFHLLRELCELDASYVANRYGIETDCEMLELMERIAASRGFLMRGGEYDYERTASAVLDDFRKGRMGRITLEKC